MTDYNPAGVLVDVSGSQVGTPTNLFYVGGFPTSSCPDVTVNNNIFTGDNIYTDQSASYILVSPTGSLPNAKIHETLQELIHLADDDGPRGAEWPNNLVYDIEPVPFPLYTIWWTDSGRTKKIVDQVITRNSRKLPVTVQWRAYATDGVTVVESYTDTITYTGVFETSRTRSQP